MNAFYRLFHRLRAWLLFLALETMALLMLSNSSYYQHAAAVNGVRLVKSRVDAQTEAWRHYFSLKKTNERLAQENNELRNRIARYESVDTLREQTVCDTAGMPLYSYIPAEVVSNSVSNSLHNYLTLNAGADKGIEPLMGVMTHNGLVGIVRHVSAHYSLAISQLNTDFKSSVKLARDGVSGTLQWEGKNYREVLLTDIPQHIPVHRGDTVVSSGHSAMFPPDIPVGIVKEVATQGNLHEIIVTLLADFKRLRYVEVVKHLHREEVRELESNQTDDEQ